MVVWMVLMMAGGVAMQLGLEYNKFEPGLYVETLLGLQLIDYLLFAMLILVVHVVVNQKYIGHLVMCLVFSFIAFPSLFKVEHNMIILGAAPAWWYTEMLSFGVYAWGLWLWFKTDWIAWALLLAVGARLLWGRGREIMVRLKDRLKVAQRRFFTGSTVSVLLAILTLSLILSSGSFIFYNTNLPTVYHSSSDISERKADYERQYGQKRNTWKAQLKATKLHVDTTPKVRKLSNRLLRIHW